MFAMRARPYRPSVVMPACGPVRLMAGTPRAWSAIERSVAALVLAGREQDVELARIGIVGDRGRQAEQLVGRVAHRRDDDDEVVAGRALARDPARDALDAVGVGHGRAAELLDDEGGRHRGAFYRPARPRSRAHGIAEGYDGAAVPASEVPADVLRSRQPPADPAHRRRRRSTASRADAGRGRRQPIRPRSGLGPLSRPARPSCCSRTSAASIRSTRSWPSGSRSTASTPSRSTGSAGRRPTTTAARRFDHMPHVGGHDLGRDRRRHRRRGRDLRGARARRGARPAARGLHARVLHGRPDVVPGRRRSGSASPASSGSTARSSARGGTTRPAPVDVAASIASPVLGPVRRRRRRRSPPRRSPPSTRRSTTTGTDHRLVTYAGAPHSFFDRKAAEFADASAAAWAETLAFIADPGRADRARRRPDPCEARRAGPGYDGPRSGDAGRSGRATCRWTRRRVDRHGSAASGAGSIELDAHRLDPRTRRPGATARSTTAELDGRRRSRPPPAVADPARRHRADAMTRSTIPTRRSRRPPPCRTGSRDGSRSSDATPRSAPRRGSCPPRRCGSPPGRRVGAGMASSARRSAATGRCSTELRGRLDVGHGVVERSSSALAGP